MKVLMFGWEFPPYNSGGLGTACYGLAKGLASHNISLTLVLPHVPKEAKVNFLKLISAENLSSVKIKGINTILRGYITTEEYNKTILLKGLSSKAKNLYGKNLFAEVYRYSKKAALIAANEEHDVIHAHDWMTYQAGIEAKKVSGKPLVVHVHATEFDRTGGNGVNQIVYDLEREGMHKADAVITVSNYTREMVIKHYGVSPDKVFVVHNAVEFNKDIPDEHFGIKNKSKVVLFLGRITLQKGPDYFLSAAKKVIDYDPEVRFIMAGIGDMASKMIEKTAEMGIGDKVLFTGFLRGSDIDRAYKMADIYVMPSVSEPFGITALESMRNGTPVIVSKQSGVSEIIKNCLKVDFWDVDKMASNIISLLSYREVHEMLSMDGISEVYKISWNDSAGKTIEVYNHILSKNN